MYGTILRVWAPMRQFCIEKCRWESGSCPLSGIKKRPFLGGCLSITTMVISIRNTECVRCREVVRFSEGPLSEVRLYRESEIYLIMNAADLPSSVNCLLPHSEAFQCTFLAHLFYTVSNQKLDGQMQCYCTCIVFF